MVWLYRYAFEDLEHYLDRTSILALTFVIHAVSIFFFFACMFTVSVHVCCFGCISPIFTVCLYTFWTASCAG